MIRSSNLGLSAAGLAAGRRLAGWRREGGRGFGLPGMLPNEKVQRLSKRGEYYVDPEVKKGVSEYYRERDNLIFRDVEAFEVDSHDLRPHPRDDNDKDFAHCMIYGKLKKSAYERLMDKQAGVDDQDVMVDIATFRFRDSLINHFKDVRQPVEDKDWFVVASFYLISGFLLWISLKQIGRWVRQPYLEAKKKQATKKDEIERKRIEEEKVNSEMVLKSRPPQLFSRFDFGQAMNDIHLRKDELDRLMKDPIKLPSQKG